MERGGAMNNSPFNRNNLSKASVAGIALAVVGIILFLILWGVLGQLGAEPFTRLLIALCVPPAVIAGILGAYILLVKPSDKSDV